MNDRLGASADDVFLDALDLPPEQRSGFLDRACAGDAAVRSEVESLLNAHQRAESFMEKPAIIEHAQQIAAITDDQAGRMIGPYRIERMIGSGGMGAVYLAQRADDQFNQQVAIKLIKRGMDTDEILARFRRERQVLADLDHPNIARLLDGGATDDGRPYLVMEFVEGRPIVEHCDRRTLTVEQRLRLFQRACAAVHTAHQNLIVHRDLKPANILVTDDSAVKLLDFGIAKMLDAESAGHGDSRDLTVDAMRPMTPRYASPEQIKGGTITTSTDIYSLGVILYELLTGVTPGSNTNGTLDSSDSASAPIKPSTVIARADDDTATTAAGQRSSDRPTLQRMLRGDLDWITLKAIDGDPHRRYSSAADLSADIDRFLNHEPVSAGPPSKLYALRKFIRRRRAAVITGAAAAATVVVVAAIALWGWVTAIEAREGESEARQIAQTEADIAAAVNEFLFSMLRAPDPWTSSRRVAVPRETRVVDVLDEAAEKLDTAFADQPVVEAAVRFGLARTYRNLGETRKAEPHIRRCLELREQAFGTDHHETLMAMNELGMTLTAIGMADEAQSVLERALEVCRRVLGEDDPLTLNAWNNLVVLHHSRGRLPIALTESEQLLDARRRALGPEHTDTLMSMNNLGVMYRQVGRLDDAESLLATVLEARRRDLGDDHPDTVAVKNNLARVYAEQRKLEQSLQLQLEALNAYDRTLGPDHNSTLVVRNNLGVFHRDNDQPREALIEFERVLEARRHTLGDDHRDTIFSMNMLADVLTRLERVDEAHALFAEAAARGERTLGKRNTTTAMAMAGCGRTLTMLHRHAEARPLLAEAIALLEELLNPTHGAIVPFREALATAESEMGASRTPPDSAPSVPESSTPGR